MHRHRSQFLRRLAACLAVGAAMTFAAAWVCAAWIELRGGVRPSPGVLAWPRTVPPDWPAHPQMLCSVGVTGKRALEWTHELSVRGQPTYALHMFTRTSSGWPIPAMYSDHLWAHRVPAESSHDRSGIPRPPWLQAAIDRLKNRGPELPGIPRRTPTGMELPTRLHWPGFALNTLFYATLTFLLISTPAFTRRTLRRRRGQCPACGYSRRGLPSASQSCPECGT